MISLSHADIFSQRCASIPKELLSYQEIIKNTCTLGRQFIQALLPTQEQANSITSSVPYMNTFADIWPPFQSGIKTVAPKILSYKLSLTLSMSSSIVSSCSPVILWYLNSSAYLYKLTAAIHSITFIDVHWAIGWNLNTKLVKVCRLREICRSHQTCLTNFENVWRGAPGSSDKMSSKVITFAGNFRCKMTDENPKCLTKNPSFVRQNDQRGPKSFRKSWVWFASPISHVFRE